MSTVEMDYGALPTAVNLDRTCSIMIAVIPRDNMCIKSDAPSNIIVFATSMLRA